MPSFVAVVARGVEPLLEAELRSFGAESIVLEKGAVRFDGALALAYRALLASRVASRILLPIARFEPGTFEALDEAVAGVRWLDHLHADGTLAVDVVASAGVEVHTRYAAQRTKDGICDAIRAIRGIRPSVDTEAPDLRVHVHLGHDGGSVAIDLAGGSMHRRGYRERGASAPLKETLASAILMHADLAARARDGAPLVDPMCGSGTFLTEGALIAADVAPGLLRARHAVERWLGHDRAAFVRVRAELEERARAGRAATRLPLVGFDASDAALDATRRALADVKLDARLRLERRGIEGARAPEGLAPGLLVVNPPYGERLGTETELALVYEALGDSLRRGFPGYDAWVLTGSAALAKRIGLRAAARIPLYNGPIECRLLRYPIAHEAPVAAPAFRRVHEEARAFENRLRKNLKTIGGRARREGLDVVRLYDADVPEYNVAVDRYGDQVQVQEYAAPRHVDPELAARRLRDAVTIVGEVLEVPRERLHLAVRKRQTSGAQYERRADEGTVSEVREGECRFEVRFDERLDTGLFADHRLLRARIARQARDASLLNLFAYTCTASVAAAKGGARATTSVDLSQTYLDWGARNFARNGLSLRTNRLVRADCMAFLDEDPATYDLVFLNPPSYSRSHRMDDEMILVRDHGPMIERAMRRVRAGGELIFSTHARGFLLDPALRERFAVEELSPKSVPFDFERSPHQAFAFRAR